jgi:hypothetical protein
MTGTIEHFVIAEAIAEFLGVSREHVIQLARAGKIPAHPLPTGNGACAERGASGSPNSKP